MKPELLDNLTVRANCPNCDGAISNFVRLGRDKISRDDIFSYSIQKETHRGGKAYYCIEYRLLQCSGCGKGAVSEVLYAHNAHNAHNEGLYNEELMVDFYPVSIEHEKLPESTPEDLKAEFVEAEGCMAFKFYRAASALFRSVLEKTLKQNGYTQGSLQKKIEDATSDGIITESRKQQVSNNIRVLGNDILHDEWRKIECKEVELAQKYAQRIIEDFYSDRDAVKKTLPSERRTAVPDVVVKKK